MEAKVSASKKNNSEGAAPTPSVNFAHATGGAKIVMPGGTIRLLAPGGKVSAFRASGAGSSITITDKLQLTIGEGAAEVTVAAQTDVGVINHTAK